MNEARSSIRAITFFGLLLAGCCSVPTCTSTGCGPLVRDGDFDDAGVDAFSLDARRDAFSLDVGRDAFSPDAFAYPEFPLIRFAWCPAREVVRPRGALPSNATPRVLWAYPQEAFGVSGRIVGTTRAEGLLFVGSLGDGYQMTAITSTGSASYRSAVIMEEGPFGPLTFASGRLIEWSTPGVRVSAFLDRTGERVWPLGALRNVELAGTSDGFFLYADESNELLHYCVSATETRRHWSMGGLPTGAKGAAFVLADNSIWMRGVPASLGRAFHVGIEGNVLEFASTPSGEPSVSVEFAGDLTFFRTLLSPDLITARGDAVLARTPVAGPYRIDPSGSIWTRDTLGTRWTRFELGVAVAQTPADRTLDLGATYALPIGEDGSFLLHGGTPAAPTLLRMNADGSIAWELPMPSDFTYVTHDLDGRVYLYGEGAIMAVQTDVLPPSVRGCWQHRCSPAGDLRIE